MNKVICLDIATAQTAEDLGRFVMVSPIGNTIEVLDKLRFSLRFVVYRNGERVREVFGSIVPSYETNEEVESGHFPAVPQGYIVIDTKRTERVRRNNMAKGGVQGIAASRTGTKAA